MSRDAAEELIDMPRGGARNRSGPPPDPTSGRSDRRGLRLDALPPEGFKGATPEFPLPRLDIYDEYFVDKAKIRKFDETATEARERRELALWRWAWSLPQAAAWVHEPWRWHSVAMWVRTSVLCEGSDATAADKNSLHRFADQIGLTPAGLKENGWKIAASTETPEVQVEDEAPADDPRGRLRVVRDAG